MIHIVLYEPEIPPHTGTIIRLCTNTGAQLHLIHPLGFQLDDAKLLRAGLDFHEWADVHEHDSLNAFIDSINPKKMYAVSTRGKTLYSEAEYPDDVALLFGPETRGLPQSLLDELPDSALGYTRQDGLDIPGLHLLAATTLNVQFHLVESGRDLLRRGEELSDATQVLYISPLKALGNDVQKNLQAPLT